MNEWVYEGFNIIYENFGVVFDKFYYELDIYLFGKSMIEVGMKKDVFYKKEDGFVWIDLIVVKLDYKIVF